MMEVSRLPCFAVRKQLRRFKNKLLGAKLSLLMLYQFQNFLYCFEKGKVFHPSFFVVYPYTRNTFIVRNIFYL